MKRHIYTILLILTTQSIFAQTKYSPETLAEIKAVENGLGWAVKVEGEPDGNIVERMKHFNIKGLSIAVVHNYKVAWTKGYGWADEAEKKPVTTETLFEPGSISKSLNAMGVLKLVQERKLDLDKDINTYLKSWKFPYDSASHNKKITIAQLLSHSAGLTVHGFPGYDRNAKIPTLPQVLDGLPPANTPAVRSAFEPGTKYMYSGGGTTITQLIVEDVTKQPYDEYMYNNVLKPLGMVHSSYKQPPAKDRLALCATGYHADGTAVGNKFHVYPEQAAAGLWMTPTDLCQYIIETQLSYEGKSEKVLSPEMTQLRLTPYNDEQAALGVFIEKHGNATYFQHSAGNEGFSGIYFGSLEGGDGVVIFANTDGPGIYPEIVNSVASVYKWKDFYTPVVKKAVAVQESALQDYPGIYLYEDNWGAIVKKDGVWSFYTEGIYAKMFFSSEKGFFNREFLSDKQFVRDGKGLVTGFTRKVKDKEYPAAVKITNPDTLHLDREKLNTIAWFLMENKRSAEALPYLKRALELYPGDLMSLGNTAHCKLFEGKYTEAIAIYKAHLKENIVPGFTWKEMITEDFKFFKNHGYDKTDMNKVFTELGLSRPAGF